MKIMATIVVFLLLTAAVEVSAKIYTVGGNDGWTNGVNYTRWSENIVFNSEDYLYFVYYRVNDSVLEVNQTAYKICNSEQPLYNWTGSGRVLVPLNRSGDYYFMSGDEASCYEGLKVAVHVLTAPPPPPAAANGGASTTTSIGMISSLAGLSLVFFLFL
ncbi:hypothetical protein MKW94_002923 [Papaver nudicaule]|uniref:Phytocyanin domain-containing protein n=1 Tax=Papaver nudicaule TaxID=74823 RepID=A0AA41SBK3_PAPNU|nr:hypothetical protein [Papaver nudicaule]